MTRADINRLTQLADEWDREAIEFANDERGAATLQVCARELRDAIGVP